MTATSGLLAAYTGSDPNRCKKPAVRGACRKLSSKVGAWPGWYTFFCVCKFTPASVPVRRGCVEVKGLATSHTTKTITAAPNSRRDLHVLSNLFCTIFFSTIKSYISLELTQVVKSNVADTNITGSSWSSQFNIEYNHPVSRIGTSGDRTRALVLPCGCS